MKIKLAFQIAKILVCLGMAIASAHAVSVYDGNGTKLFFSAYSIICLLIFDVSCDDVFTRSNF